MPPVVAAFLHGGECLIARGLEPPLDDQDVLDRRAALDRLIGGALEGHHLPASVAAVGGDERDGPCVVDPVAECSAEKPPKTTECTAPSRAQASMAMTTSGIIGR
jgi:hypothetical protein